METLEVVKNVQKRCHWRSSGPFIITSEHISHIFLVFALLTLNKRRLGYTESSSGKWQSFLFWYVITEKKANKQNKTKIIKKLEEPTDGKHVLVSVKIRTHGSF